MSDARTVIAATEIKVTDGDDGYIVIALGPDGADAILAALAEAGLVIVPRAPTEKMVDAGLRASEAQSVRRIYFEMLGAANEQ
jgi:hypothetical protein